MSFDSRYMLVLNFGAFPTFKTKCKTLAKQSNKFIDILGSQFQVKKYTKKVSLATFTLY